MKLVLSFGIMVASLSLCACVTKRTVTENGRVIEKKNVIKRPVKNLINNTEFE